MTRKQSAERQEQDSGFLLRDFEKPFETAMHFGFLPVKTPSVSKEDLAKLKIAKDPYYDPERIQEEAPCTFDVLEKITLLRAYETLWGVEHASLPFAVAYKKPIPGTNTKKTGFTVGLELFGLQNSSAEALVLRTALSMLHDEGHRGLILSVNSIGDKDSVGDFERMVGGFVRKHMNGFPADIRKMAKRDIFDILRSRDEKHAEVQGQAPKSLSFLSEASRTHFKEVLEYVEHFDIPFQITPRLIGSPAFCSHTIFEIRSSNDEAGELLAHGYWYSRLSRKLGLKKELPALGATVVLGKKVKAGSSRNAPKPKFYLIQLGFSAKLRAVPLIERLRKANITIGHSLSKDKLSSQLGTAENLRLPYVLIIGQKEAIENSVVVRNIETRSQETVPMDSIVEYLKKLK